MLRIYKGADLFYLQPYSISLLYIALQELATLLILRPKYQVEQDNCRSTFFLTIYVVVLHKRFEHNYAASQNSLLVIQRPHILTGQIVQRNRPCFFLCRSPCSYSSRQKTFFLSGWGRGGGYFSRLKPLKYTVNTVIGITGVYPHVKYICSLYLFYNNVGSVFCIYTFTLTSSCFQHLKFVCTFFSHAYTVAKIPFMYSQKRNCATFCPNFLIHVSENDFYIPRM